MRLHRFIGKFDLREKTLLIQDETFVQQWRNVLRLGIGDSVILSDGNGKEARATIIDMDKKSAEVQIESIETPNREPQKHTTLYCAVLKRENFELVVQKATEIGISKIVPILTERTVKTGSNQERLLKIIREASEQSGRTTVPELSEPMKFKEAIESADPATSILFDLSGSPLTAATIPHAIRQCFIGPEGGFSNPEVQLAKEKGISIGMLGKLTLRGETAAIIASYLLIQ